MNRNGYCATSAMSWTTRISVVLSPEKEEEQLELDSAVAQIVIGVRRCGKSTLCQKVLKQSGVTFAYANLSTRKQEL